MDTSGKPSPNSRRGGASRQRPSRDPNERQWRELAGNERTALTLSAALRARDADQPTPKDVAEAERAVVVQRRNWRPQE